MSWQTFIVEPLFFPQVHHVISWQIGDDGSVHIWAFSLNLESISLAPYMIPKLFHYIHVGTSESGVLFVKKRWRAIHSVMMQYVQIVSFGITTISQLVQPLMSFHAGMGFERNVA
jgi:hypothetical protein